MSRRNKGIKQVRPASPASLGLDRRDFIKCTALAGGALALGGALPSLLQMGASPAQAQPPLPGAYLHHLAENQIFTVCQQCNTNCGIKVKLVNGQVAKIDGSPYNPFTLTPHIDYKTPIGEAALIEGALCPKGQAGIQTLYDPYRIVKVLKRVGKRGENKWKSIPFEQAVKEVVEGGDLFGEGRVEGLNEICALKDPAIHAALAKDAAEVAAKKMTLEEFKSKQADNLKYLIDPDHPDLGPKNNQFCMNWGRLKGGRSDFIMRFTSDGLGSYNYHGHTTVCQGSLYFTCKAMSDQFVEGKFTAGSKFYWQADTGNAEFIIFVGANPFEANYGPPHRVPKLTRAQMEAGSKMAVVDPRCSKTAARAWKWLPVAPLGVGALGVGMMRWIIENARYDARYLMNANKAAAKAVGEPTWTQAAWLVKLTPEGKPGAFLRGSDLGQKPEKRTKKDGSEWEFDPFLVWSGDKATAFDPNDDKNAVIGELLVDREVGGHKVKSVLQVYREAAAAKTLAQWAGLAGVKESDIVELAREFTSHGKKAVCDIHRGVSQHTSGFYNVLTWMTLNVLIGNHDWQGGLSKATTFDASGKREGQPFDTSKAANKIKPWGISIIRHGTAYDKSTIFQGYPAKRPWYPFASDIYQEVIPSIGDQYPYPIKALMLYMGTPVYSLPAGHALVSIVSDPKKLPLFIVSDITVGETSMFADYIFPDLTYLERWEFSGSHPSMTPKIGPVRQPAAAPLTETVTVYGEKMPLSLEALLLGLAEAMKLPAFGENALGQGRHFKRPEDLYLRMVANLAFGDKADGGDKVPAADAKETETFLKARRHLPASVFDPKVWETIVGPELWPHVVYLLNRGGRFQGYAAAYKDGQLVNKYGKMIGIYMDNLAKAKNSMTGKTYLPHADYLPGPADCAGNLLEDKGYGLTLITYKDVTQTKSRTITNYWLSAVRPENWVEVSAADAASLGLKDGDTVKVTSASNVEGVWELGPGGKKPMVGKVKVREGLRPGVVAFSLGHGHWANGAGSLVIDGVTIPGDPRRATGIHANAAMRLDPVLKNTGLVDVVGGSAVFYQSAVKLTKA
ncbi:MAG: molybdopterin-dependent oxidoreductase [Desulfarculus sp.]|nr:molybdopterin-dependent oxidoreductase [Desulfarculus sp.]